MQRAQFSLSPGMGAGPAALAKLPWSCPQLPQPLVQVQSVLPRLAPSRCTSTLLGEPLQHQGPGTGMGVPGW